ncbi:MAG: hypothetical protein R3E66_15285 [bacterium]
MAGFTACSQPKNTRSDDIEGRPPTAEEDPFFFVAIPANAQKVDTRGTIEMPAAKTETVERPVEAPDPKVEPTLRAEATVPDRVPDRSPPSAQCFSCVEICNVEGGQTRCEGREDIICGWGVHPERETASRLATAECDGALDVARESTRYARIEGSCPVATCR